jgi:hypothetical protein
MNELHVQLRPVSAFDHSAGRNSGGGGAGAVVFF